MTSRCVSHTQSYTTLHYGPYNNYAGKSEKLCHAILLASHTELAISIYYIINHWRLCINLCRTCRHQKSRGSYRLQSQPEIWPPSTTSAPPTTRIWRNWQRNSQRWGYVHSLCSKSFNQRLSRTKQLSCTVHFLRNIPTGQKSDGTHPELENCWDSLSCQVPWSRVTLDPMTPCLTLAPSACSIHVLTHMATIIIPLPV